MGKGDAHETAQWQSMAYNDGYAKGRAEGRDAGLEEAERRCRERIKLYDAIEPDDPMYAAALNRMAEAEECAEELRALKEKA